MEETVIMNDGRVYITNTRYIVGGKTYALRNITSVELGTIKPNVTPYFLGILIGLIGLVAADQWAYKLVWGLLLIGSIAAAGMLPKKYTVKISSTSGETDTLISKDHVHVSQVVRALNKAISGG